MKPNRTYFRPLSARTRQHDPGTSMSFKASLGAPAVHSDSTPFWYSSASCPHGSCADAAGCEISIDQLILGMVYYFWGWWFTVDDDFGEGLLLGLPFTKAVFIIKKMCSSQNGREWKGSRRYRLCCRASHARCQWSAIRTFGDCPYRILSPRKVMIKFHPDHQNPSYSSHPIILFQASPVWHSHLMSIIQISPDLLPSAYKSPKRWMASFKITFVAWGCFAWPLATRSAQKACSSSPTPGCTGIMTVSGHQKFIFQQPFSTPFQAFSLSSK